MSPVRGIVPDPKENSGSVFEKAVDLIYHPEEDGEGEENQEEDE